MTLFVQKMSGANTVQVCRDVDSELKKLQKDLPTDVKIEKIFDTSEFIQGSINNLTETLMYAGIFVMLVVLFFLGRWRATLIIILTIPISLLVAFIYIFLTGASINIISLSSLSIAIGMVVDDAIVVLENITKTYRTGKQAARGGHLRHERGMAGGHCHHPDGCCRLLSADICEGTDRSDVRTARDDRFNNIIMYPCLPPSHLPPH